MNGKIKASFSIKFYNGLFLRKDNGPHWTSLCQCPFADLARKLKCQEL